MSASVFLRCAAALLLLCAVAPAHADDPAPLRTVTVATVAALKEAVAAAKPGDDIVLSAGTYEISRIRLTASGTPEHPIRLRAERPGAAKVLSTGVIGFAVTGAYWTVEGLDIRGVCEPQAKCEHAFHITGNADGIVLRDNRMRDFNATIKGNGAAPNDPAANPRDLFPDDVTIAGNDIYNTAPRATAGPVSLLDVVGGRHWVVQDNFVADFQKEKGNKVSYGMYLKGNSSDGVFERNLILCNWKFSGGGRIALSLGGGGTGKKYCERQDCSTEHTGGIIRNNILLNCTQEVGIYLNRAKDTKIYNNIVANTRGIDIRFKTSSADIRNNVVSGAISDRDGGDHTEANNFVVPQPYMLQEIYVDYPHAVFRLRNERPIMGKGRRVRDVTDDFCGNRRILPAYDIGAIDYGPRRCSVADRIRKAEEFGQ